MQYVTVFCVVFCVIGLRGFQQKVVNASQYPLMGIIGAMIYAGEGTAIVLLSRGGYDYVLAGAAGAGFGVVIAVYMYNKYCTNLFKKKGELKDGA